LNFNNPICLQTFFLLSCFSLILKKYSNFSFQKNKKISFWDNRNWNVTQFWKKRQNWLLFLLKIWNFTVFLQLPSKTAKRGKNNKNSLEFLIYSLTNQCFQTHNNNFGSNMLLIWKSRNNPLAHPVIMNIWCSSKKTGKCNVIVFCKPTTCWYHWKLRNQFLFRQFLCEEGKKTWILWKFWIITLYFSDSDLQQQLLTQFGTNTSIIWKCSQTSCNAFMMNALSLAHCWWNWLV